MDLEWDLPHQDSVSLRRFKEKLRGKLPPESAVLADLLREPDSMPMGRAEVLIPHYLQRLERESSRNTNRKASWC